ncbi:MAG: aminotransferase class V-fold PLP-dependent enzyme [Phycisphaerales bacterium]
MRRRTWSPSGDHAADRARKDLFPSRCTAADDDAASGCTPKEGRYNTPNTFGVYLMGQVFRWIAEQGGLEAMRDAARREGRWSSTASSTRGLLHPARPQDSRSMMNVTFKCPTPELDKLFLDGAGKKGLSGLKGHRSIGGMRASMYNAFPKKGAEALVDYMKAFANEHAATAKA